MKEEGASHSRKRSMERIKEEVHLPADQDLFFNFISLLSVDHLVALCCHGDGNIGSETYKKKLHAVNFPAVKVI